MNSLRHWFHRQRSGIDAVLARTDRANRAGAVVESRDRRVFAFARPGLQFLLLSVSILFDAAWFVVWFVVATRYRWSSAFVLASLPVLKWLLLLVARHSGDKGTAVQPALFYTKVPDGKVEIRASADAPRHGLGLESGQASRPEQDFPQEPLPVMVEPGPMV